MMSNTKLDKQEQTHIVNKNTLNNIIHKWLILHTKLNTNKENNLQQIATYKQLTELLMKELIDYVYFILLSRTNKHTAEDLTSKTMIKIYKNVFKYQVDSQTKQQNDQQTQNIQQQNATIQIAMFKTWVYKITLNTFTDYLRKQKKNVITWFSDIFNPKQTTKQIESPENLIFEQTTTTEILDNTSQIEHLHQHQQAKQILNSLKPQEKDMLMLRFYYGMTYKELAIVFNTTETSMRKRFSRLIQKIRKQNMSQKK